MGLQEWAWLGAAFVAALSAYNFIVSIGQRRGATDAQVKNYTDDRHAWEVKFDAMHNLMQLNDQRTNQRISDLQLETSTRFEKVMDRLNAALLTMAREHPTKADLNDMKDEILARIDGSPYNGLRRKPAGKT